MLYRRLAQSLPILTILSLLFATACSRETAPPTPLPAEQIPAVLQQAFASAKPEAKDIVGQINTALAAKDYPKAYYAVQALASQSALSKSQQAIVGRTSLTLNNLLNEAQAKGDAAAAQTLQTYRGSK